MNGLIFQISELQINSMIADAVDETIKRTLPLSKYIDKVPPLTISQAAEILNVNTNTIRNYCKRGKRLFDGQYVKLKIRIDGKFNFNDLIEFNELIN